MTTTPGGGLAPLVDVYPSVDAFESAAAGFIVSQASAAIQARGRCLLVLSGGTTPRGLYRRLAAHPWMERVDWSRVHLCFGDERVVPPEDPQSNFGMVRDAFLSHVALPGQNVHRIRGEINAEDAARAYDGELRQLLRDVSDDFDIVLLGVGVDGHTASLFPGSALLHEPTATVRAAYGTAQKSWRVTMTVPMLSRTRNVVFLVRGKDKASIVRRVLHAPDAGATLPAAMIRPAHGTVRWMLDPDAGSLLGSAS